MLNSCLCHWGEKQTRHSKGKEKGAADSDGVFTLVLSLLLAETKAEMTAFSSCSPALVNCNCNSTQESHSVMCALVTTSWFGTMTKCPLLSLLKNEKNKNRFIKYSVPHGSHAFILPLSDVCFSYIRGVCSAFSLVGFFSLVPVKPRLNDAVSSELHVWWIISQLADFILMAILGGAGGGFPTQLPISTASLI